MQLKSKSRCPSMTGCRARGRRRSRSLGNGGSRFVTTLREVAPDADPVSRTFRARFALTNVGEAAPDFGRTATLHLQARSVGSVAALPISAIGNENGTPVAWVIADDGQHAVARPVTVQTYEQDRVLVSAGLNAGDRVVAIGVHKCLIQRKQSGRSKHVRSSAGSSGEDRHDKGLIVVTGASGFIAKHIVLQLLDAGYAVRATVRSKVRERANCRRPWRSTFAMRLILIAACHSRCSISSVTKVGIRHSQAPMPSSTRPRRFPLVQPKDENDLIRPALTARYAYCARRNARACLVSC